MIKRASLREVILMQYVNNKTFAETCYKENLLWIMK